MAEQLNWAQLSIEADERTIMNCSREDPLTKNFYREDPEVASLSKQQVARIRDDLNNLTTDFVFTDIQHEINIPNPISTFEQCFGSYPQIMAVIKQQNFTIPTPIQCQSWPILMSGMDMIGIAQTGTGKTLAFLLPALIHIAGQRRHWKKRPGPTVLILAPTRELAIQIHKEVEKYPYKDIKSACIYGGVSKKDQIDILNNKVAIVIATPGRLNDLILSEHLSVLKVSYLVLDEADRMLDMGFEPQIRKSLYQIRPDRQTVMTSATWPNGVRRLASTFMKDPVQVNVGSLDLAATHTVRQSIVLCPDDDDIKFEKFVEFVTQMEKSDKVLVFCGKKAKSEHISSELAFKHITCEVFNGDRDQCDREAALEDFASGRIHILIATDLASRGLDINDVTHVFNYDFPRNIEEYVHRVGRTGRAGRSGEAITLVTRADWQHAEELIKILEEANQAVPEELRDMSDRYKSFKARGPPPGGRGRGGGRGFGRGSGRSRGRWY